ncbi:DUF1615 family protein [Deltaproteobacteria bacterium IMCC39524]|nr:DUF1615 family protein [Deltaproteobacteria bacterium IMCC39524]
MKRKHIYTVSFLILLSVIFFDDIDSLTTSHGVPESRHENALIELSKRFSYIEPDANYSSYCDAIKLNINKYGYREGTYLYNTIYKIIITITAQESGFREKNRLFRNLPILSESVRNYFPWFYKNKTSGPMEVNITNYCRENKVSTDYAIDKLHSIDEGIKAGVDKLIPIINSHISGTGSKDLTLKREFVFADYCSGIFSCRNAALQARVNDLLGKKELELDGDLLIYSSKLNEEIVEIGYLPDGSAYLVGQNNKPVKNVSIKSATERAVEEVTDLDPALIRKDLVLSKTKSFEETKTYLALMDSVAQKHQVPIDARMRGNTFLRKISSFLGEADSVTTYVNMCDEIYKSIHEFDEI